MEDQFQMMKNVIQHWIQGEPTTFIKVWLTAYLSLTYCYITSKFLHQPTTRLAAFLPVIILFLLLPLHFHTVLVGGISSFFLAWLANFKLIMFAFHTGPLSGNDRDDYSDINNFCSDIISSHNEMSLPKFIALASLPIKLQSKSPHKQHNKTSYVNYFIKTVMFTSLLKIYDYENSIHPLVLMVLQSFQMYLCLELTLAISQAMARGLLGAELEPQFNEPYLSASLQDFWGKRWNLMVTRILRPAVYLPVLGFSSGIVGRKWAPLPAVMSTFVVSGLVHELLLFYYCRMRPTWGMTWFFVLHGACLTVEILVKKVLMGRLRLPRVVATVVTAGFVMGTGLWLFLPQFLRCDTDKRALMEVSGAGAFVKDIFKAFST